MNMIENQLSSHYLSANKIAIQNPKIPALFLVHGAYHGAWCWQKWMEKWENTGVAAIALDLPGHGKNPVPENFIELGINDYADATFKSATMLERPLLGIGHSLGGLIIAKAAETFPFLGLRLLAPSPPGSLVTAAPVSEVPIDQPRNVPDLGSFSNIYLGGADGSQWYHHLSCESPKAQNDRYGLRIPVNPNFITKKGFVIEAGIEDERRHPLGQDKAVADYYGYKHCLVKTAPIV